MKVNYTWNPHHFCSFEFIAETAFEKEFLASMDGCEMMAEWFSESAVLDIIPKNEE